MSNKSTKETKRLKSNTKLNMENAGNTIKHKKVPFYSLYRFCSKLDILLLIIASLISILNGIATPMFSILFGSVINDVGGLTPDFLKKVEMLSIWFTVVGVGAFIASSISLSIFIYVADKITTICRVEYFKSALRQEIEWYDSMNAAAIASRLSSEISLYNSAIGEKVCLCIQNTSTFFIGIVLGFIYGWHMALVVLGCVPILAIVLGIQTYFLQNESRKSQTTYEKAGAVATDAIKSIRTVMAFSGQEYESNRYETYLKSAMRAGVKKSMLGGLMNGSLFLIIFSIYGAALWFGVWLIRNNVISPRTGDVYSGGEIMTIFFLIIIGAMAIGQVGSYFPAFTSGAVAANKLYEVIDRKSRIDYKDEKGKIIDTYSGNIKLNSVSFYYNSRKDFPIFKNLSISVETGKTIAIVGASGGGKSTIMSLIERFYDPIKGNILADNTNIQNLNLEWWRNQISFVKQEPILFSGSIYDNIKIGKHDATEDEVMKAAKAANAHEFILKLKEKYETNTGDTGKLLSGGQKQRIAIARALIRNPKILLLDEATSALDHESEKSIQKTLNEYTKKLTTIVIAHRLSTIQKADKIIVLVEGEVLEEGTHEGLLDKKGAYMNLINAQKKEKGDSDYLSEKIVRESLSFSESKSKNISELLIKNRDEMSKTSNELISPLKDEKDVPNTSVIRLLKLSSSDWPWIILSCLCSCILGIAFPLWALFTSDMISLFNGVDHNEMETKSQWLAILFFLVGLSQFIAGIGGGYSYGIIGERLTKYFRYHTFKSILRQEIGWFDDEKNNSNILISLLSKDASLVSGVAIGRLPILVQSLVTISTGIIISMIFSYKISLVILATTPILFLSGIAEMQILKGFTKKDEKEFALSNKISNESIHHIRTIASFNAEEKIIENYKKSLSHSSSLSRKKAIIAGIGYGFGQSAQFFVYALAFWYGTTLVANGEINFRDMMIALFAALLGIVGAGHSTSMAPDLAKAKSAKNNIFNIIDRKSSIDPTNDQGEHTEMNEIKVKFSEVIFNYPVRPNDDVLKGLSFDLNNNESLAVIGESGAGKSTIISLLLRFYDHRKGIININKSRIENININHLRSQIGLVQQEPILFNITIKENIKYGKQDSTNDEIIQAAKKANIHDVIEGFPKKYDTICGEGGSLLSGGQKQRIAIARAIIRNPKLLLLDEATSALDTESEKIVQKSLDDIMKDGSNRSTIIISHRLSSIKNCSKIMVMDKGNLKEYGTHKELMELNGMYANRLKIEPQ